MIAEAPTAPLPLSEAGPAGRRQRPLGLNQKNTSFTRCPPAPKRTPAAARRRRPHAEVMFIGEAPGYYEDQQARPFVGAAGQFLEQLLGSIGLKRNEVFIANVFKCRPPSNRDPLPVEIDACKDWLEEQVEIVDPEVI